MVFLAICQRYFERHLQQLLRTFTVTKCVPSDPVSFEDTPSLLQNLIAAQSVHLLGRRTVELHLALAANPMRKIFFGTRKLFPCIINGLISSLQSLQRVLSEPEKNIAACQPMYEQKQRKCWVCVMRFKNMQRIAP